jgi:hypothetical protein
MKSSPLSSFIIDNGSKNGSENVNINTACPGELNVCIRIAFEFTCCHNPYNVSSPHPETVNLPSG